jgi:undecaprenyl-diphosphatase
MAKHLEITDSVMAGVAQGISVIPGISRSGFTVATLLLRDIDDAQSLKLSFIMSLPVVLMGNILLNTSQFVFTLQSFVALVLAFGFGFLTIHFLLKTAEKTPFGWFMIFFGFLVSASAVMIR